MPSFSGLADGVHGVPYTLLTTRSVLERRIAMAFERRGGRALGALAIALNGSAPGGTATATLQQVEAIQAVSGMDLGGKRGLTTRTLINRATTAADEAKLDTIYDGSFSVATYPVDKGQGGGGKVGTL